MTRRDQCGSQRSRRRTATVWLLASALLAGAPSALALSEQEQRNRILFETREQEARFAAHGYLYGDAALDAYLQSVMDRLYPEKQGTYRVHAYRNNEFNAFAVATGNVYVHVGALLRLRNEAELASVLGHEGGHLVGDHMYKGTVNAKSIGRLGTALSIGITAIIGIDPFIGAIASYSTMAGFSRDFEREADRTGFERMVAAGYDPRAAAPVFDRMARELTARKVKQGPYFFADHPKLLERVKNFTEFAATAGSGELRRDAYLAATQPARVAALESIHERKDGPALIALLEDEGQTAEFAPAGEFLLGEGYRLRAAEGDEDRALSHYDRSIAAQPDYAPAYAVRGRILAHRGERGRALEDLERYVALAPAAREAPFARQTIERLKKETNP